MIVDCHVNLFEERHVTPLLQAETKHFRPDAYALRADPDTVYAAMAGVDRAIVFSLRYGDASGIDGDDDITAQAVAKYPEKFVGFAALDPRRPDAMELLEHAIHTLKLRGIKFGPIYNGVSLLDPRMEPFYRFCLRHDLPLTMHLGTTYARATPVELGRPIDVDAIARRHPDLKMIMAHMAHPWYEECIVIARKQPNVYCEVSALSYRPWQFYNILIAAQEYTIHDRNKIFWGTDFPYSGVAESLAGLRGINRLVEGTALPRVAQATIDGIIHSDPFAHWWHAGHPG
jgi:predicted TIM-barrel fold metal-dependent hydrolase